MFGLDAPNGNAGEIFPLKDKLAGSRRDVFVLVHVEKKEEKNPP